MVRDTAQRSVRFRIGHSGSGVLGRSLLLAVSIVLNGSIVSRIQHRTDAM